jgi:hypothetical protein
MAMIKLFFVLMEDSESKNTMSILNFLNGHVTALNKLKYIIDIKLITKDNINSEEFTNFRKKLNIQSIPTVVILEKGKPPNAISDAVNIGEFFEHILNNKSPGKREIATQKQKSDSLYDESDDDNNNLKEYMTNELFNNNNDNNDILATGHDAGDLIKKMKNFSDMKNNTQPGHANTMNSSTHKRSDELSRSETHQTLLGKAVRN